MSFSGLHRQGDLCVMWCVGGDGERYTSRPMDYEKARELLERWNRAAVPVASLHLSADVVERLVSVAEQWRRDFGPQPAECVTWEDMAHLAITTWLDDVEHLEPLRRRDRPRLRRRARRSIARLRRGVNEGTEPGAAGG